MVSPCAFNLQFSQWLKMPYGFSPAMCNPFLLWPLPKYTADSLVTIPVCREPLITAFLRQPTV